MTDKDGQILPLCEANIKLLQTSATAMNQAFGSMQVEFSNMRDKFYEQQRVTGKLEGQIDRLASITEKLNENLEARIDQKIDQRVKDCPFFQIAKETTKKDITKKLKLEKSIPPEDPLKDPLNTAIKKLPKKAQIVVGIIVSILTVAGSVFAWFV